MTETVYDVLDEVVIQQDKPLRLSAATIRALTKATGRTLTELLNDDEDEAARLQVMAFAELHRRYSKLGHLPDAATLWEQAEYVEVDFVAPPPVDPTDADTSRTSPHSVDTGE